jgi:hypothetical protein
VVLHRIYYFWGAFIVSNFFFAIGQSNWLIAKKKRKRKVGLVRHPQLINMKLNKYPQFIVGREFFARGIISPGQKW